jgi:plastocyanin
MAGRLLRPVAATSAAGALALALAGSALGIYHGGGGEQEPPADDGSGTEVEVVAGPQPNTYQNPQVTIDPGEALFFRNADSTSEHDVTSTASLFRSATIPAGRRAAVRGVESLDPGSYRFFCSVHPVEMRGTLTVRGAILGLRVMPRRARVRAPATQRFRATVRNRGDAGTPSTVRVCAARTPRGINVRGDRCRAVGALAAGATAQVGFRVRVTRRASRGRNRIGFAARSPGSRNAQAQAVLRVRR